MKKRIAFLLLCSFVLSTLFMIPAYAEVETVTVPVTVSGVHNGTNEWANATYTCTVTDGVPADNGILSNGKYSFKYFPGTGQIKNNSSSNVDASNPVVSYVEGYSGIPVVVPTQIGAFTIGSTSYEQKSIVLYALNTNHSIFRYNSAFDVEIIIPEGVESIPNNVFGQMQSTNKNTTIILPSTLKSIGTNSFQQSSGGGLFKNIVLPDGLTSIASGAFQNIRFSTIVIPEGVTVINSNTFAFAYNLSDVTFKGEVTSIGATAFRKCTGLKKMTFEGKTAPTLASNVFQEATSTVFTVYYPADGTGYGEGSAFRSAFPSTVTFEAVPTSTEPVETSCSIKNITNNGTGYTVDYEITLGLNNDGEQITDSTNLVALFNENALVSVQSVDSSSKSTDFETTDIVTRAMIFVWDGFEKLKPLCVSDTYTIQ